MSQKLSTMQRVSYRGQLPEIKEWFCTLTKWKLHMLLKKCCIHSNL